jgi:hypothetical protein
MVDDTRLLLRIYEETKRVRALSKCEKVTYIVRAYCKYAYYAFYVYYVDRDMYYRFQYNRELVAQYRKLIDDANTPNIAN